MCLHFVVVDLHPLEVPNIEEQLPKEAPSQCKFACNTIKCASSNCMEMCCVPRALPCVLSETVDEITLQVLAWKDVLRRYAVRSADEQT